MWGKYGYSIVCYIIIPCIPCHAFLQKICCISVQIEPRKKSP